MYRAYILCESFIQKEYYECNIQTIDYVMFIGGGIVASINHGLYLILSQVFSFDENNLGTVYESVHIYYKDFIDKCKF